jgi:3-hydroxyisobutyrate dehydrogenase
MSDIVGVVGAGRMGLPIIGHLVRAGYRTLVSELDAKKRPEVDKRGAVWEPELTGKCDVILICVGFDREVADLLARGLAPRPDGIVAILSTVHPKTVQDLSRQAKRMQVIDSTVCRGGEAADKGTLLSFVGGPVDVVARITPVLKAYSADVVHTGEVGSAQVAKAVNNLILWACLVADHEGLALAKRYGVDTEMLRRALEKSSAANDALAKWGKQTMAWAEDDMAIISAMAAESGIALPQAALTREICRVLKPRRYKLDDYGA